MTSAKERKLCADFPELTRDHDGDPRVTSMSWGFTINDGWEPILRRLLEAADARRKLAIEGGVEGAEEWRLSQVKEKWGGLRVYWEGCDEAIGAATALAEEESFKTCEDCGSKEGVTTASVRGWIRSLCPACRVAFSRPLTTPPEPAPAPEGVPA